MPSLVREYNVDEPVPTWFLGIDPGVNGGLAAVHADGSAEAVRMPATEAALWAWVRKWGSERREARAFSVFACVELVSGWVGHKRAGREGEDAADSNPGSAMFTFGQSYGMLRMALVAAGVPFEAVRPQAWQKELCLSRPDHWDTTRWKNWLKERAQALFSHIKVTKATADALLIAEYARTKWGAK